MNNSLLKLSIFWAALILIAGGGLCVRPRLANAGTVEVIFSAQNMRETLLTLNTGQAEFVHLAKIAELFHLTVEIDEPDGHVTLSSGTNSASFFPGQTSVIASRRSYFVETAPLNIEGAIMIPLQFVSEILPLVLAQDITWEPGSRRFLVGTQNLELSDLYSLSYGEYTRIIGEFNQALSYNVTEKLPSMLIFEFPEATFTLSENPLQIQSRSIKHVKVVDSFGSTQVIVRLGGEFVRYTHQMKQDPPRWILDVYHTKQTLVDVQDTEIIVEEDLSEPTPSATPATAAAFSLRTVVLDPGHGGSDPGITIIPKTEENPGLFEKDLTLKLARALKTSLTQRLGVRIILTRDSDEFISAESRATIANSNRADVFLSLHINNSFSSAQTGFETYIMDYGSLEQPQDAETLHARSQLLDFAQADYVNQSEQLAQQIVSAYRARNAQTRAVVKHAPLFTLKGTTMPAVHIEVGYASNSQEQQNILQKAFQQVLVSAIADGLAEFKQLHR